jgi:hypothetical protein
MNSQELAELQKREGVVSRMLLWITARNRSTGAAESIGLSNCDDVQVFNIGGNRTYFGPAIVSHEPVRGGDGLDVRYLNIDVAAFAPEVEEALRTYDARLAPVEVHLAFFSAETRALIDIRRVFLGWLDQVTIGTPAIGGEAIAQLSLASVARAGTKPLPVMRSDASQRARSASDAFRVYVREAQREVIVGENKE